MFKTDHEKVFDYREIGEKFEVVASTTCKEVNTAAKLFRVVPGPNTVSEYHPAL